MPRTALLCAALLASPAWAQPAPEGAATPAAAAPAPAPSANPGVAEYRLAAGDALRISVYQNTDLTLEVRLPDNGMVSYPLLGALNLLGRTIPEVEALISDGLRKGDFVKNPQVTVLLVQVRGSQVNVLGQVNRPGRYPLETAAFRLSDALALAGGLAPQLANELVVVVGTRNGQPFRREVDLPRVFAAGGLASEDIVLQANDVVYVDRAPTFYIYGEVQRPGQLRLERGMTLLQGLAAGGGLTLRGSDKGIRVHRRGTDGNTQQLQPGMDDKLRDGDVIYVRESLF